MLFVAKTQTALIPSWLNVPFASLDFKTIKYIPAFPFGFFIIILSLFALYFFYQCYKNLATARKMEDTPTAKIRSAPQGYVELEGIQRCHPQQPTFGFLSGLPCTWYRYAISRYRKKRWVLLEHGRSNHLFLLDDGTGVCLVDPTHAEVTTSKKDCWYGFRLHPQGKPKNLFSKVLSAFWGSYRYQEWRMEEGMPLYVLGNFKTVSEYDSLCSQSTRFKNEAEALAQQWKKNKHASLAEFDLDKDGKISDGEWEKVLKKAQRHIEQKWLFTKDSSIYMLNASGLEKKPFILAARQQKKMIRHMKYLAVAWLFAYVICATFAMWLLSIYLR